MELADSLVALGSAVSSALDLRPGDVLVGITATLVGFATWAAQPEPLHVRCAPVPPACERAAVLRAVRERLEADGYRVSDVTPARARGVVLLARVTTDPCGEDAPAAKMGT